MLSKVENGFGFSLVANFGPTDKIKSPEDQLKEFAIYQFKYRISPYNIQIKSSKEAIKFISKITSAVSFQDNPINYFTAWKSKHPEGYEDEHAGLYASHFRHTESLEKIIKAIEPHLQQAKEVLNEKIQENVQ